MASAVQCELCPKGCLIKPGEAGECRVRVNLDGELAATTCGYPCAIHTDPIEKKPLYHFLPGTKALSLATVGCNLHCLNCQNWEISQEGPGKVEAFEAPPEKLLELAVRQGCRSVCFTYTEPVVFFEYVLDTARKAREGGSLKTEIVTAAYVNPAPFKELCSALDAVKIDFKACSDKFYREVCGGSLKPVLKAMEVARASGVHLEIVNLLIPTLNDSEADLSALVKWVKANLGAETPLHFLGFHPDYRMRSLPPTSPASLKRAREMAKAEGLNYVYIGNIYVEGAEDTSCSKCGAALVKRRGYLVSEKRIGPDGNCPACGERAYGVWK